jgi:hypothetical protein
MSIFTDILTKIKEGGKDVSLLMTIFAALPTVASDVSAIIGVVEGLTPDQKTTFYNSLHAIVAELEKVAKSL